MYQSRKHITMVFVLGVFLLAFLTSCDGPQRNNIKLKIISDIAAYNALVKEDSCKQMVNIKLLSPDIALDIRYATANNFTGKQIYDTPGAYVRKPVAEALASIQKELNGKGMGLKIFDAYRPYAATVKFYKVYPDTNFVAAPWKGSVHNRGCAVDLTLIDLATGSELEMPTPFDDFSEKASHHYPGLNENVIKNREILKQVMLKYGFEIYDAEWWHYDFKGWKNYELMDISFEELSN